MIWREDRATSYKVLSLHFGLSDDEAVAIFIDKARPVGAKSAELGAFGAAFNTLATLSVAIDREVE